MQEVILNELGCHVSTSSINRALQSSISKNLYNKEQGYSYLKAYSQIINEKGGYANLQLVDASNAFNGLTIEFLCLFVSLKEQRQYSKYINYVCIDACHLSGKYGGIMMCASSLDANGKLCILAQSVLAKEGTRVKLFL